MIVVEKKTSLWARPAALLTASATGKIQSLDKKTGDTIFEFKLPTHATGVPMTYLAKGKQYIVLAIGGRGFTSEFDMPGELQIRLRATQHPQPRMRQLRG